MTKKIRGWAGRTSAILAAILSLTAAVSAQEVDSDDAKTFELLGKVVSSETGAPLVGAWVGIRGTEWGSLTDGEGRFRIPDTEAGEAAFDVEMLGYERLAWDGRVDADRDITIELAPQPIVLEGLAVVSDRFRSRRNAAATSVYAYERDDLSGSAARSALEFIEFSSAAWLTPCRGRNGDRCLFVRGRTVEPVVYVDEIPRAGGLDYLDALAPWEFQMIEVYAGGRHIRAYTPAYMERAAKTRIAPLPLPVG